MTTYGYLFDLVINVRDASTAHRALNAIERNDISENIRTDLLFKLAFEIDKCGIPHHLIANKWQSVAQSDFEEWCYDFKDNREFLTSASDEIPPENTCFECPDLTLLVYLLTLYVIFITFVQCIVLYY